MRMKKRGTIGRESYAALENISASSLDAPRRIFDLTTGLPSLTTLFADLRYVIDRHEGTTIFYVHLSSNRIIEERYGWEALEAYVELVHNYLGRLSQDVRREREHCIVTRAFADDYVVLMPRLGDDAALSSRIVGEMNRHIAAVDSDLAALHEVYVGRAHVTPFPKIHPERLLYRGIQQAQTEATDVGRQKLSAQVRVLDGCLAAAQKRFSIVYQPLVRLDDMSIFAYEALARCSHEQLRNPHVLFNVAEQGDRVWPLSRRLRKLAVTPEVELPSGALLFVNLHPSDFEDPQLLEPEEHILALADRLVLEVTERAAIGDFNTFRANIDKLRALGLRVAIDDLGSGYAALSAAAELDPEFIKFDMTLIRDIDQSPIRQNLVRNMVAFAVEAGAQVVAEGVETEAELNTVRDLGCHLVQGFLLARPAPPFVTEISRP
jgi:EAL domain-containing protein (putative c-di-GMP-specific phosphodiesterase class I)